MKRINNRKFRLGFYLKWRDGSYVRKRKKTQIIISLQGSPHKKGYLRVMYKPDIYNDADFNSKEEALKLLTIFTEKSVLDYAEGF